MDEITAGLIGVGIGGLLSLATAVLTPWVNARLSEQQFARDVEQKKLASLEAVLEEAALALERMHWAIRDALFVRPQTISSGPPDESGKEWHEACVRMDGAQEQVSRQGTRLAVRLGTPARKVKSPSVKAYNDIQCRYRSLVREVRKAGLDGAANTSELEKQLDELGDHHAYLNQAADLLRPTAVRGG